MHLITSSLKTRERRRVERKKEEERREENQGEEIKRGRSKMERGRAKKMEKNEQAKIRLFNSLSDSYLIYATGKEQGRGRAKIGRNIQKSEHSPGTEEEEEKE